ncbi:MAG: T9SS type A sorting domain-containing protein [Bacteroidales bacterium]|nr:T9SS type A sorting domain-containing protein [Bacteroidales bacterium]
MKKQLLILAGLLMTSMFAVSQTGWIQKDSDLGAGEGIGNISVAMNDADVLWASAIDDGGGILEKWTKSTDGGETWTQGTFNAGTGLSMIFAIDENTCWAVFNTGADQGLYKTEDGGTTWVKKGDAYGSGSFANVIHFFNDNDGFAQGDPLDGYYELYTTTDGGESWTRVPEANIPEPVSGEYGITGNYDASGDNIWFGTNKGRIFRSTDKGYNWEAVETPFGNTVVVQPEFKDANNGICFRSYLDMGIEPTICVTSDGGQTWTSVDVVGDMYARWFSYIPGTDNTYVGSSSEAGSEGISFSCDGGYTWNTITEGFPFQAQMWEDVATGLTGTWVLTNGTGGIYVYDGDSLLPLDPPTNLDAEVMDENDVHVSWSPPGGGGETEELIYDNDIATGSYSYEGYTMSTHMSPSGPCQILTLKYWTSIEAGDNTFDAKVFNWDGGQPGTTVLHEVNVTAVDEDWMEVDISGAGVNVTDDFVVGFGSINGTTYVGYDAELDNGRSWDYDETAGTWSEWNEAYLIRAIVQYEDGSIAEITGGRELLGYNVYRDDDPEPLNDDLVTDLYYDDMDLANGTYTYTVRAEYDEGLSIRPEPVEVTISAGDPIIEVIPTEITQVLPPEGTADQPMAIENSGTADLIWDTEIEYVYTTREATPQNKEMLKLDRHALTGLSAASASKPIGYQSNSRDLLWDNTDIAVENSGIVSSVYAGLPEGEQLVNVADDFIVPGGYTWSVDFVYTEGFLSETVPDVDGFYVAFYYDDDGKPGDLIYDEVSDVVDPGIQQINLQEPVFLIPGHYWVSVAGHYNDATTTEEGRWNWYYGSTGIEEVAMLQDESGLFGGFDWTELPELSSSIGPSVYFILEGTENESYDWLSVDPASGTVAPDDSEEVTVMFDAEGLEINTYMAYIHVNSNDPETPTVTVDVTLDVLVGVNEIGEPNALVVYPNPAKSFVNIEANHMISNIKLMNHVGQLVYEEYTDKESSRISTSDLPAGVYMLQVETKAGVSVRQIIVE